MQFSKLPGLILIPIFLLNTSCAGMNKKPAQPHDKPKKYVIQTTDQGKISVVGDTIMRRDDQLIVRTKEGLEHRFRLAEVEKIKEYGEKKGSYWLPGLGIGFLAGAIVAGAAVIGVYECQPKTDCDGPGLGLVTLGSVGAVVGSFVGAGIGLGIPKRKKIIINPLLLKEEDQTYVGGGLTLNF